MNQLNETTVHQFLAHHVVSQQRNLVAVQFDHRLSRQFTTDAFHNGIDKHLQELVHSFLCCLAQRSVAHYYLFHIACKVTIK